MRVCLMIEGQEDVTWDQWLALAGACEEHGLEGLFRSDHYESVMGMRERGSLDAWATLAALAARTSRIRLGTLVSPATFRHPSVLAKNVATVDHVSGGRVELGLGAGWHEGEHRAYGFEFPPTPTRMERLAEQLEIVTRSWTEDAFSFQGRHYQVQDLRALPKPVQRPRPTLLVGGGAGPKSLGLAARWADEYNTTGVPLEELLLQSVLMVGYPRALVAFTIWRKMSGLTAPESDPDQDYSRAAEWTRRGEELCAVVYGENYQKLRASIQTACTKRPISAETIRYQETSGPRTRQLLLVLGRRGVSRRLRNVGPGGAALTTCPRT